MNKLTMNQRELQSRFQGNKNLGEVFRLLEQQVQAAGEIICRFSVNGLSLSEEDEEKFAQFGINEVDLLEVESQRPQALLLEVIENWIESLPRLIEKSDKLSQAIRFEGIENHMAQFVDVVDSCHFLVESLNSLRVLCREYEFIKARSWQNSEEMTARAISEALSSFEKKDLVLLADVLEYDLGHCLQNWLETISELKEHVQGANKVAISSAGNKATDSVG
jgi:hypothetical protein